MVLFVIGSSAVFFADDEYRRYLDWLREAALEYGIALHAHVLANYLHLLATAGHAEGCRA